MRGAQVLFVTTVRTYTAQYDCEILAHAFGGSGSGAVVRNSYGTATGGGAGARCSKRIKLRAGETLILTPGAGGTVVPVNSNAVNGGDGAATTITGPDGLNMIAGGGKGGKGGVSNGLADVLGGLGGIATGGDENVTGGRGGNVYAGTSATNARATGGGALPLLDVGYRGGDIVAPGDSASGGGGIGGNGGDIINPAGVSSGYTGGGSPFGDAATISSGTAGAGGPDKPAGALDLPLADWFPYSSGGPLGGAWGSPAGHGSGGAAAYGNSAVGDPVSSFGGSGGARANSGSCASAGCTGIPFGGSGGAVGSGAQVATAAPGGNGFIVLEFLS